MKHIQNMDIFSVWARSRLNEMDAIIMSMKLRSPKYTGVTHIKTKLALRQAQIKRQEFSEKIARLQRLRKANWNEVQHTLRNFDVALKFWLDAVNDKVDNELRENA